MAKYAALIVSAVLACFVYAIVQSVDSGSAAQMLAVVGSVVK